MISPLVKNRAPESPLIQAIESGDENSVRMLLQNGASPNETNSNGETALMVAATYDRGAIADLLLKAGADINASYAGSTPLHYAAEDSLGVLQRLISAGTPVNSIDSEGYTPLMLAVYSDNIDHVQALLQAGADATPKNNEGFTALRIAREEVASGPIVDLLLRNGARE